MNIPSNRRKFLKDSLKITAAGTALMSTAPIASAAHHKKAGSKYTISLAEWSLRGWFEAGKMTNLDFADISKNTFGIHAIEYVSRFFDGKEGNASYLKDLKKRTDDLGVQNVLIMVDMYSEAGALTSSDKNIRKKAAENHHVWVDAAKFLDCHCIRVNAYGYEDANYEDALKYTVDGMNHLVEYGKKQDISIVIENHGGHSSNGRWLRQVMREVDNEYFGTLPDFGNFKTDHTTGNFYDPYVGMHEIMPFAKGVSAKSSLFDDKGDEILIDYPKMIKIVKAHDFGGYVGVEWGGKSDVESTKKGIMDTKKLLETLL